MKNQKSKIKHSLFRLYLPVITRVEKFRATRMWLDGVKQAEKMHKETGGLRAYLFFDSKHMCWSPMTWKRNKFLKPSFLLLRSMGKMRASQNIKRPTDLEHYSFYFTSSKKHAHSAAESNSVREEKLKNWIDYYMSTLSEPMLKCQKYQQEYYRQHSQLATTC